jgi:hypothetical protein
MPQFPQTSSAHGAQLCTRKKLQFPVPNEHFRCILHLVCLPFPTRGRFLVDCVSRSASVFNFRFNQYFM